MCSPEHAKAVELNYVKYCLSKVGIIFMFIGLTTVTCHRQSHNVFITQGHKQATLGWMAKIKHVDDSDL